MQTCDWCDEEATDTCVLDGRTYPACTLHAGNDEEEHNMHYSIRALAAEASRRFGRVVQPYEVAAWLGWGTYSDDERVAGAYATEFLKGNDEEEN